MAAPSDIDKETFMNFNGASRRGGGVTQYNLQLYMMGSHGWVKNKAISLKMGCYFRQRRSLGTKSAEK